MASIEQSTREIKRLYTQAQKSIVSSIKDTSSEFTNYRAEQLRSQIDVILQNLDADSQGAVLSNTEAHYFTGHKKASDSLNKLSKVNTSDFSIIDQEAVSVLSRETNISFQEAIRGIKRSTERILTAAERARMSGIIADGVITGKTLREISGTINEELKDGFVSLIDRSGKRWQADVYAEMLARTKMREATNTGLSNRLRREGYDLVMVSSHNSHHEGCARWEGKILSISGESKGYYTVDEVSRMPGQLFHPNCKHRLLPYHIEIDGIPPRELRKPS